MQVKALVFLALISSCLAAGTAAFTQVTVIDVTGGAPLRDQTVIVAEGRIAAMGKTGRVRVPKGATVVKSKGKYLIPGLWDMHVHTVNPDLYLRLYVANGVTGVRDMGGSIQRIQGWKRRVAEGTLIGPRVYAAGPIVDGKKPVWQGNSISVASPADARDAVAEVKRLGADFVKVYSLLSRESYFAVAAEAKRKGIPFAGHVPELVTHVEASAAGQRSFEHQMGIFRACSTMEEELRAQAREQLADPDAAALVKLIGSQYTVRTMVDTFDERKASALFQHLAKNGTWQTPTLIVIRAGGMLDDEKFVNDPRLKYMRPSQRNSWDPNRDFRYRGTTAEEYVLARRLFREELAVVGRMHRAGVGILAGTDASNPYCFPGFGLHDELGLLVEAGLTPLAALQTATLNPARYFGILDSLGTVETGKLADLVLLDADPLADIGNTRKIAAVVTGGRLLERRQLDSLLADVEALAAKR